MAKIVIEEADFVRAVEGEMANWFELNWDVPAATDEPTRIAIEALRRLRQASRKESETRR